MLGYSNSTSDLSSNPTHFERSAVIDTIATESNPKFSNGTLRPISPGEISRSSERYDTIQDSTEVACSIPLLPLSLRLALPFRRRIAIIHPRHRPVSVQSPLRPHPSASFRSSPG